MEDGILKMEDGRRRPRLFYTTQLTSFDTDTRLATHFHRIKGNRMIYLYILTPFIINMTLVPRTKPPGLDADTH